MWVIARGEGTYRTYVQEFPIFFPPLHMIYRPPYPYPGVPVRYGTAPPPGVPALAISWNVDPPPAGVAIRCTGVAILCTGVAILCTGVPVRCIGSAAYPTLAYGSPYARLGPGLARPEA